MRQTRPYPYERWAKLTRKQHAQHVALRALWDERGITRARDAARALLGAGLEVHLHLPAYATAAQVRARLGSANALLALRLELWDSAWALPWWLELAWCDAHAIVDRCLGGEGTVASPPTLLPLDELGRGTLAYLAARVLAALGGQLQLRDIVALPLADPPDLPCAIWPISIQFGGQPLGLRLYVPEDFSPEAPLTTRPAVRDLRTLPLTLIAYAGQTRLPLTAAQGLRRHDVVVLDESDLVAAGDGSRPAFRGQVQARLPGSGSCIACSVGPAGLIIEAFNDIQDTRMTTGRREGDASRDDGGAGFGADAQLELQVEVARFSLSLAELQRLQVGDVLATGRRIGERVSLRVGGQPFAEGELVDIEGEVGVRLLTFARERTEP